MRTIIILLSFLPVISFGQCFFTTPEGILSAEVNGDTVLLKNDSVCRTCGVNYIMKVYDLGNDTLIWTQVNIGNVAFCECNFNLSVMIDSLHPGYYITKVYHTLSGYNDSSYVGTIAFNITNQNLYLTPKLSNQYQSPCYNVNVLNEEILSQMSLTTFPNPSHDNIKITCALEGEKLFRIYDVNNRCVKAFSSNEQEKTIDISDLPNSIYNISVESKEKTVFTKFCKY